MPFLVVDLTFLAANLLKVYEGGWITMSDARPASLSGIARWEDRLFITLARGANDATSYFQIPSERVVEIGTQVNV